jgi:RND family efflux transporter MFP subunit
VPKVCPKYVVNQEKTVTMKQQPNMKATQRLTWFTLATLIAVVLIVIGCSSGGTPPSDVQQAGKGAAGAGRGAGSRAGVPVQTTTVQRISIQRQVDVAGSLVSSDQARVSSEVAGVVQEVLVQIGDSVQPGQVLARLNPTELDVALRRAQSQLRQTEAQLGIDGVKLKDPPPDEQISSVRTAIANRDDAQAQLRRAQRLRSQNLLPQADLDTAETRVKVTEANLQAALESVQSLKATLQDRRQAVELTQKKLNDAVIRSSIAGQINERLIQPGEFIRENTPIVSVVKMNPLKLRTAVQERYAGLIRLGMTVEFQVEPYPGEIFRGRVSTISPAVDTATRTFPIEVLVDNGSGRLKPGLFAKGVINTKQDANLIAVSEDAISTLAGVSSVYVIEGNKARQQNITLGTQLEKLVEVTSGLNGDETLATSNLTMLATGVQVQVTSAMLASPEGGPSVPDQQVGRGSGKSQNQGGRP